MPWGTEIQSVHARSIPLRETTDRTDSEVRIRTCRECRIAEALKSLRHAADMRIMDRRSEVRMLCADMVEICWKDGAGKVQGATALLEDICPSGACLQMESPIPLGSDIYWGSPRHQFNGYVRYCVYREIGYFVGVEFTSTSKWSKKTYKPQHLLDLQKLVTDSKK